MVRPAIRAEKGPRLLVEWPCPVFPPLATAVRPSGQRPTETQEIVNTGCSRAARTLILPAIVLAI